jgi:hypothetical protein
MVYLLADRRDAGECVERGHLPGAQEGALLAAQGRRRFCVTVRMACGEQVEQLLLGIDTVLVMGGEVVRSLLI